MGRVFTTPRKSFEYNFYERSTLQLVPLTHSQVLRVYHIYGRVFASFVYTMPRHLSVCPYVIDPPVHLIIPSLFACPLNGVMDHVTLNPSVHTHGYIKRGRYVYGESCTLQCTEPHTHARTLVSFVFVAAKKIKIKKKKIPVIFPAPLLRYHHPTGGEACSFPTLLMDSRKNTLFSY